MAGLFGYSREAVRVKAKKCDGEEIPEYRKFSVDPQITSYEVLRSILAKAFDLRRDFSLSYKVIDDFGQETFLSLLSDWDLDAAFLSASEPCLCLQIDVVPCNEEDAPDEDVEEEWEAPLPPSAPASSGTSLTRSLRLPLLHGAKLSASMRNAGFRQAGGSNLQGLLKTQVERTLGLVQRALQVRAEDFSGESCDPEPPDIEAVGDAQFRSYLDPLGTLVQCEEMREAVFHAGVDPALRKVVWKHLLNVYPEGLSGRERIDYMKRKAQEYQELKDNWRTDFEEGQLVCQEVMAVSSMVRKDVLRTDRHLSFYAGNDDNQNVAALFNVLTTYALNHPSVSYCQGMSDLASPLLVTMQDEPSAYVCFCALMRRLQTNFSLDGFAMGLKFQHLSTALLHYDPEFHRYLQNQQASDLLFCYRWLLLELKREFAFEDALRMLEVLWASLPAEYPTNELPLFQGTMSFKPKLDPPQGPSPSMMAIPLNAARHSAYTRLCAMRRRDARRLSTNKSLDERQLGQQQVIKEARHHRRPFLSLDDSDLSLQSESSSSLTSTVTSGGDKPPVTSPRVVRNLNEFKNFFSKGQVNGSRDAINDDKSSMEYSNNGESQELNTHEEQNSVACDKSRGSVCNTDEKDDNKFPHGNNCSPQKLKTESPKKYPMYRTSTPKDVANYKRSPSKDFGSDDIFVWENPIQQSPPPSSPVHYPTNMTSSCEEALENSRNNPNTPSSKFYHNSVPLGKLQEQNSADESDSCSKDVEPVSQPTNNGAQQPVQPWFLEQQEVLYSQPMSGLKLPPPAEFGGGNPFLVLLCVTLLRQHRDIIMRAHMDYNELAMHLDRMVRKHNVRRVLREARALYRDYLAQYGNKSQDH